MTSKPEPKRRRGTPISAGFAADLQTLGTLLGNHTRGLDAYLQRQANRVEERYQGLLADAEGFLLPPDLNLDAMTKGELQTLCRSRRLRGWSRLRRDDLLAFMKDKLSREIEMSRLLHKESLAEATPAESTTDAAGPEPNRPDGSHCLDETDLPDETALPDGSACFAEATRSERLLLLLLQHLNVPWHRILAAWQEPDGG